MAWDKPEHEQWELPRILALVTQRVSNTLNVIGDSVSSRGARGDAGTIGRVSAPWCLHLMLGKAGAHPVSVAALIDARQKIPSNPKNTYLRRVEDFGS
jgi:hypothetical protein